MRFVALIVALLSPAFAARDLKELFAGRSGSALVFDLKEQRIIASWNEARAQSYLLRPGSTLKPFTLATFIDAGLYREKMNAPEAMARSENEFFDGLIARMDREDYERGYARLGLNARSSTATLAQMMQASRRLLARQREARLRPVFAGMEQAVEYGTARLAKIAAVQVAGKTGTTATSALFFGYAPAAAPRYIVWVHLDTGSGGGDAAPFGAKIFQQLFAGASETFDPTMVSVRLYWQNPPRQLNLKPGDYAKSTLIDTGVTKMRAPGPLRVRMVDGHYELTAKIGIEDYVTAVLHGEASGFKQEAAREAMAIAARTYTARFRGRHGEEGFDYCDTTHCQDARFVMEERSELRGVVEATAGEMLWQDGKPAEAYYHADSGGWLENPARKDPWWKDTPEGHWHFEMGLRQLAGALNLSVVKPVFAVRDREASGRVRSLNVFGHPAEAAAFRMLVGRTLGWEKMPSRLFEAKVVEGKVVVDGVGRGHGMGLAQTSAERMAAAGKTASDILKVYYPQAKVGLNATGMRWQMVRGERVTIYTTQAARDRALIEMVERELPRVEALVGMKAEPVVRVYPTREAFRDATGITANVNGATRGRRVMLIAGTSVGTVRHELLHAVLESNGGAGREEWLKEGLVQALLGEKSAEADRVNALMQKLGRAKVLEAWRNANIKL